MGVDVYCGSPYNIVERICNAAEKYKPQIVVRCLLRRFYIDIELIKSMISKIQEGYDYVDLANDVNLDVGSDVTTYDALLRTNNILKNMQMIIYQTHTDLIHGCLLQTIRSSRHLKWSIKKCGIKNM